MRNQVSHAGAQHVTFKETIKMGQPYPQEWLALVNMDLWNPVLWSELFKKLLIKLVIPNEKISRIGQ